jgi:hypothetical protein
MPGRIDLEETEIKGRMWWRKNVRYVVAALGLAALIVAATTASAIVDGICVAVAFTVGWHGRKWG